MTQIDSRTFLCEHCTAGFVVPEGSEAEVLLHICRIIDGRRVWDWRVKLRPTEGGLACHLNEDDRENRSAGTPPPRYEPESPANRQLPAMRESREPI